MTRHVYQFTTPSSPTIPSSQLHATPCNSVLLAPQPSGQPHILILNGDSLGVDRRLVRVFKEADEVGFRGLLQGADGGGLESQVRLELLRNLAH